MPHLYMILIGGMVDGCHVELHDVRFAVGPDIAACIPALKAQWWGTPKSLHLDAWGRVEAVDGYSVSVAPMGEGDADERAGAPRLFFCNMGGYDPAQFTELHANVLVVATDAQAARRKATARIRHWTSPHKDGVMACESVIDVAGATPGWRIALTPGAGDAPFAFEARYVPIGKA